jgi:methionyl-tRNA synthetase
MPNVNFDDFKKVDLRVGKIISAERVEGSPKLLKLKVDLGPLPTPPPTDLAAPTIPLSQIGLGIRQIFSGIGKVYEPESLVGKNVALIANLEPRMMMGMESQGMVLAASGPNGPVVIFLPDDIAAGSLIT